MKVKASTIEEYLVLVPDNFQPYFNNLRQTIKEHLPPDFEECLSYGMIGYVVPKSIYPHGYHCDQKLPLPFLSIAAQKNFVAVYHMGIYAQPQLLDWFTKEYPKHCKNKLDIGKSCIRFKKPEDIPLKLIAELATKMTAQEWISCYEQVFRRK